MIDTFKADEVDEVYLIYTKIQNALTAEPVMLQLLPLERSHFAPLPPALGDPHGEVELFPDAWSVFKQMAPIYMHGMIFGAMTESYCAEQSARMTAMDSATKSATDMIHALQLEYNRTRQGCNHPGDHRDHRRCFCCANQRLLNFLHCIPLSGYNIQTFIYF